MRASPLSLAEAEAALERKQRGQSLQEQAEEWSASLKLFLKHAWPELPGGTNRFVPGWHIDAICEHLEAVSAGEIRRLVICVPPGSTKSSITSICWPAWEWTRDPTRRYITASYDRGLATDLAMFSRTLIESTWYQHRWGHRFSMRSDENLKTQFANTRGGRRISVPTSGATGKHADLIIIDDPHDASEILSDAKREEVIEWHDGTIVRRFADLELGAEVIIAQRLHEKDLIGHVLAKAPGEWEVLCLPERYESKHPMVTPPRVRLPSGRLIAGDPREIEGELLCPARVDDKANAASWRDMGSFRAAGQLQQRPAAREGAILKRQYFQFYPDQWRADDGWAHLPKFHGLVQSWDTAFKDRTVNDYVAGGLFGLSGPRMFLLATRVERMSLSQTKQAIRDMTGWAEKLWPRLPMRILIENKTNGPDIIAELRAEIRGIIPINSDASKVARAEAAEPTLESRMVYVPGASDPSLPSHYDPARTPHMTQSLIEQCASFPFGENDDQVDFLTQAINWSRQSGRRSKATLGRPSGTLPEQGSLVGQLAGY